MSNGSTIWLLRSDKMVKIGRYLPLIISFIIMVVGIHNYITNSTSYILLLGFGAIFAAIGILKPNFARICKYLSMFFVAITSIAVYFSTENYYIPLLAISVFVGFIIQDLSHQNKA
jgi:hypothetical protein